ncbi:hypothetical protein SLS58_009880 [Diplodia intermedia]|uniref:F-box domain-containing protein n=1 Tax=Diplodia intermedia TaxID=856260 RepID=A0ABR3T9F7_9PEZI
MSSDRFHTVLEEERWGILCYLSTADLVRLLRVSRRLRHMIEPMIYDDVVLDSRRRTGKFKRFCKRNPALAKRVTGLTVDASLESWPMSVWNTSKICHGLEYLDRLRELTLKMPYIPPPHLDSDSAAGDNDDFDDPSRKHEEKLDSTFARATHLFRAPAERRILPSLTRLCLETQMIADKRCPLPGLTIFFIPTLQSLEIWSYDISECATWGNGGWDSVHDRQHTALEILRLQNCRLNDFTLGQILECPRALRTLCLTNLTERKLFGWSTKQLSTVLKKYQQKSLRIFELCVGRTTRGDHQLEGTLDLSEMERLETVRCFRYGARLPKAKILLGPQARLTHYDKVPWMKQEEEDGGVI